MNKDCKIWLVANLVKRSEIDIAVKEPDECGLDIEDLGMMESSEERAALNGYPL